MPYNDNLPSEYTDPWYAPFVATWNNLKTFVNGLETAIGLRALQSDLTSGLAGKAYTVHTHAAGDVTSGTFVVARIPDLSMEKVTGLTAALGDKADLVDGFIPTSQLPPIALTEFLGAVDSESAMLALDGQRGDWAIRTDVSSLAILTGEPSSDLGNWELVQIGAGAAGVTSINDQSGIVVLGYSDVGAASAAQGALAATALQPSDVATVATSGAYEDLTGLPTLGTAAAEDVEAFATAGQGALADSAVQPGDLGTAAASDASDFAGAASVGAALWVGTEATLPPEPRSGTTLYVTTD